MDSQVSHNLVSSHFGIKRRKLFFNSPQHYMNQLLKLFRKRREKKKKRKRNIPYSNFFFEVDMDLKKLRDGNFCFKNSNENSCKNLYLCVDYFSSVYADKCDQILTE